MSSVFHRPVCQLAMCIIDSTILAKTFGYSMYADNAIFNLQLANVERL